MRRVLVLFLIFAFIFPYGFVFADAIELSSEPVGVVEEPTGYDKDDLLGLIQPSVVRILQHVEGTATIPSFIVDGEKGTIAVDPLKEPIILTAVNENILGTGFFVSSAGHILTNSHTVSDSTVKLAIVFSFIQQSLIKETGEEDVSSVMARLFKEESVDYILKNTTFDLTKDIIVLDPTSDRAVENEETLTVYDLGFFADVITVNDTFYKEGSDVALIQIQGEGYPSNVFSDRVRPGIGSRLFAVQPVASEDLQKIDELRGTGVYSFSLSEITVTKESGPTTTPVFVTNGTLEPQFAGSPVFDSAGSVVGMTAFDGASGGAQGAVSLYVIPNEVLRATMDATLALVEDQKVFHEFFGKGIFLSKDLDCEGAKEQFAVAKEADNVFVQGARDDVFLSACQEERAANESGEKGAGGGFISVLQNIFDSRPPLEWAILGAVIVVLMLIVILIRSLFKKEKRSTMRAGEVRPSSERSNEMQKARRAPASADLSESVTSTTAPFGRLGTKGAQSLQASKEKIFHTIPSVHAQPPKTASDKGAVEEAAIGPLPEEDKERLAKMWPNKYGEKEVSSVQKTSPVKDEKERPITRDISVTTPVSVDVSKEKGSVTTEISKQPARVDETLSVAVDYIKETRKQGFSDDEIRAELAKVGWTAEDVVKAFGMVQ